MRDKWDRTTSDKFIEDRKEGGHEVNEKKFLGAGVKVR